MWGKGIYLHTIVSDMFIQVIIRSVTVFTAEMVAVIISLGRMLDQVGGGMD